MSALQVMSVQRGRSPLAVRLLVSHAQQTNQRLLAVCTGETTTFHLLPTAPELDARLVADREEDEQVHELLAAILALPPDERAALLAAVTAKSVCDQSVTTETASEVNHTSGTAFDLPVCPRWVAPPSGLELRSRTAGPVGPGPFSARFPLVNGSHATGSSGPVRRIPR